MNIRLTAARGAIAGMLEYAQAIPTVPVARSFDVSDLAAARAFPTSPSWSSIFIRAYGLVCERNPQLRRAWISWPTPRLYEHPCSVCAVAVERLWQGERAVLMGMLHRPEGQSLEATSVHLRTFQEADVWSIATYRATLRFGALPAPLRRLVLWVRLDWSGRRRVKNVGSFGFSNYGKHGAESLHPIGPQTTVMTLGPIEPGGRVTVKLVYDHRVLDGADIARALAELDEVLHGEVLNELQRAALKAA